MLMTCHDSCSISPRISSAARSWASWFGGALCLVLITQPVDGGPKKSQKASQAEKIQRQIQQVQQRLAAVKLESSLAQSQARAAAAKLAATTSTLEAAVRRAERAAAESGRKGEAVRQIEQAIEAAQPPTSPYARAKAEFLDARAKLDAVRQQILNSATYLAAYEQAKSGPNRAEALARLRTNTLQGNAQYRQALLKYELSETTLGRLRLQSYQRDPAWPAAAEASQAARQSLAEAQSAVKAAALHQGSAKVAARDASRRAASCQAMLQQTQATLNQLVAAKKRLQPRDRKQRQR